MHFEHSKDPANQHQIRAGNGYAVAPISEAKVLNDASTDTNNSSHDSRSEDLLRLWNEDNKSEHSVDGDNEAEKEEAAQADNIEDEVSIAPAVAEPEPEEPPRKIQWLPTQTFS
jgi:hypothetical protein